MKITVYSFKGSAGKTPIATNMALEKEFAIGTNEPYNILDTIFPEERLLSIQANESFPPIPAHIDIVFDLAGMISKESNTSILSAVKQSDVVLVPIYNELKCIHGGIHTIRELQPHTQDIVIVTTKLQKQKGEAFKDWADSRDHQNIMQVVSGVFEVEYPAFPLKFSKAFDAIFEHECSINQLMQNDPLLAYSYREVGSQFDTLLAYLEREYA